MPLVSKEDMYNAQNVHFCRNIFIEYNPSALFTLSRNPEAGKGVPLADLYIALTVDDPSEATFVDEVFGDFFFWKSLSNSQFFKPHLEEWKEVAEIKRKQKAFKAIMNEVKTEGKSSFSAAKYLIEEPWRGAPTAAERKRMRSKVNETTEKAFSDQQIQEDVERLKKEGLYN